MIFSSSLSDILFNSWLHNISFASFGSFPWILIPVLFFVIFTLYFFFFSSSSCFSSASFFSSSSGYFNIFLFLSLFVTISSNLHFVITWKVILDSSTKLIIKQPPQKKGRASVTTDKNPLLVNSRKRSENFFMKRNSLSSFLNKGVKHDFKKKCNYGFY